MSNLRPGGLSWSVLMAVHKRRENAYGVTIREEIAEKTGRQPSYGAVYTTLARLETEGLLVSHEGDPTPERGGRAKRFYRLTGEGAASLKAATAQIASQVRGITLADADHAYGS